MIDRVHGIAHITGGGFFENVPRMLRDHVAAVLDTQSWPVLPLFRLIQQRGEIETVEMYEVFNMGLGLVLAVAPADVPAVREAIPEILEVGAVIERTDAPVILKGI